MKVTAPIERQVVAVDASGKVVYRCERARIDRAPDGSITVTDLSADADPLLGLMERVEAFNSFEAVLNG